MIKTLSYPLTIEHCPEDGGYLAVFPTLPGCQTWGETYEAAVRNAEEVLAVFIETLAANGDPIPEPTILTTRAQGKPAAILMSAEAFSSFEQTAYLLQSPRNAQRLMEAVAQLGSGDDSSA
ncbi:MAG: type II toxin-antitoxin system HicB family antitoxin [Methylocystis sp.]|jgi:antitoxin YefM